MIKNELKVLTTAAQTLVAGGNLPNRIIGIHFCNPTATTTTFELTLTDAAGTTVTLRKAKSLAQNGEDDFTHRIVLEKGDKLEALASVADKIHVLVNYEPYNGSPTSGA